MTHRVGFGLLYAAGMFSVLVSAASAQGTRLLRDPAVSRDHVAFVYADDIWLAPRAGGEAVRLTTAPGSESSPRFSPDGTLMAFTGQYDGNSDVYVIPVTGGEPKRLTYHPAGDGVAEWTPDGRRILFTSARGGSPPMMPRLWTIGVQGGMPEVLPMLEAYDGWYSPDGKRMAYLPHYPVNGVWRRYRGGATTPVWLIDLSDYSVEKIPRDNSTDTCPMWLGDAVYFLSDRSGTTNLFSYRPGSGRVTQLTHYTDYDIRSASASTDTIVYEQAGYLYLFDPVTVKSTQLQITARADFPWTRPRWANVGNAIHDGDISPTGARAVLEARGDIFTVPASKGEARNLTRSPGAHERSPAWSPDGTRIAWFSDASGEYQLMVADQAGSGEPRAFALPGPSFYGEPLWSPDSKRLAFTDCQGALWFITVDEGATTLVDKTRYGGGFDAQWSPDSKWIGYTKGLANLFRAVFLYSVEGATTHQVTDGLSDAASPAFDRDGKYLYFAASTDVGLSVSGLDMSSYGHETTRAIYLVVLSNEDPSPFLPESDEEKPQEKASDKPADKPGDKPADKPAEKPAGAPGDKADSQTKPEDTAKKADEKAPEPAKKPDEAKEKPPVRIDLDGIEHRVVAVPIAAGDYSGLQPGGTGGTFFFMQGGTLRRYDLKAREAKDWASGVRSYAVSANGKKLLYRGERGWSIVDAGAPAGPGQGSLKTDGLEMLVDPKAEWAQIYREAWRIKRDFFYDPAMHGEDWGGIYRKYLPLLEHVVHRADLNYVLDLVAGEMCVGHNWEGGGDLPSTARVPVGLLGADIEIDSGLYRIKHTFTGESWNPDLQSPLRAPGVKVADGDYILAVNARELRPPTNFYSAFEQTAGRQTVLRVNHTASPDGAWDVTVVPVSNEMELRVRTWVEDNRRRVDELSGGRLAYVYLPDTGGRGYSFFNRYLFAQEDKEGAVIDERFNGGGSVADYFIDLLSRPLVGYFVGRTEEPITSPAAGVRGPKVMLINQSSGSGGDWLPYAFRKCGVGPLIGTTTWGGLVGIGGYPQLVDGGFLTAPSFAFYNTEGKWDIENTGVPPDIEVEQTPALAIAGHDPQLERAVEECMKRLGEKPFVRAGRPAPADRTSWKREGLAPAP